MKNFKISYTLAFLFIFSLSFCLAGCQKASINGDLDGRWQIMEIEHQGVTENIGDQQLYYNFYLHVCNLSYYGGTFRDGNFLFENNSIKLDFPYTSSPEAVAMLSRYGIYSNPVEFKVAFLDKKKLIIQNDESIITLRKF